MTCSETKPADWGRQKSLRLLLIHLAVCAAAVAGAFVFRALHLRFLPCAFHLITGKYCLTCGATRAVLALLQLDLAGSFLLNPLPLLLVAFMGTVMGFELVGVLRNRYYPFRWLPHVIIGIVSVLTVFSLLRNFGVLPPLT